MGLAYDLGRFAGIDDSEALSKMQDAISGNAAALADYGVKLDGATLKQTAQSMGISTAIEDMDEATAAQVRMNAILSQTSQMQGEASRSLGGYAGGMKAIQAATQGFMEKAGNKLAPMFDKIFSTILNLWPKVEPAVMAFVGTLGDGIADLIPTITEMAEEFLPSLIAVFSDLAPVILQVAKDVLPPLMQAFGTVMTSIQPLLPLIGDLIHSLLPPLADIFTSLLRSILPPLIDIIKAILPPIPKLWILFFQHYCLLLTLFYQLSIY
jgi:phage-related protein